MITFRPMREGDLALVATWLDRDHVQEWWRDPSAPSRVHEKYGPRILGEVPTEMFVVLCDDRDIGTIQRYRLADHPDSFVSLAKTGYDPTYAAGIDYLIGEPDFVGRGVGTEMVRAFTERLFADLTDVRGIAVTPQSANIASCRVLEKAGYRRAWLGRLESDDPSDEGESALYVTVR